MLTALFNGKIAPWERKFNHSPNRSKLEKKIESETQYFNEKLSSDDCQRLEKLFNLLGQANCDEEVDVYLHGFTLGSLMMMEVMDKKGDIINE